MLLNIFLNHQVNFDRAAFFMVWLLAAAAAFLTWDLVTNANT